MGAREGPHGKDLRKGRVDIPGQVYVITTVTHHRQPLFQDLWAGRCVVNALRVACARGLADSLAFVVMPDHLRWMVRLGEGASLGPMMASVKANAGRLVNAHRNRSGSPLWQRGYHDHAVRRDEDLRRLARYIVANPVRTGLADSIGDFPLWDAVWV